MNLEETKIKSSKGKLIEMKQAPLYDLPNKLEEKASIDWNNYLTPEEVKRFLSKDDKIESAENIIYSKEFQPRYRDLHNSLQTKYKNSWTKKELVQDLNDFYNFGHLITEDYVLRGLQNGKSYDLAYNKSRDKLEKFRDEVIGNKIITTWIDEHKIEENKIKGVPIKYQFMVKNFYKGGDGYWNIDLADGFENNDGTNYIWDKTKKGCLEILDSLYQDYKKSNKITESNHQDMINRYIEENTNSLIGLKELASKVRFYISSLGRKYNKAKYDYERNNYKRQQEFYREVLIEINNRLKKTESKQKIEEASRNELLAQTKKQTISRYKRSEGYKGFYIYDIDTSNLFTKTSPMLITCKVGNYHSQVEIQDVLLWVQLRAEDNPERQINTKNVSEALSDSIDGMDIKVNCECRRFCL